MSVPVSNLTETEAAEVARFGLHNPDDSNEVWNAPAAYALPESQWVQDADGQNFCIIETHMGFPQRMAVQKRHAQSLESLTYPLHLGDFVGDCEHKWGTWELGHCVRCGQIVGEPHPTSFDEPQMKLMRDAAALNARNEAKRAAAHS